MPINVTIPNINITDVYKRLNDLQIKIDALSSGIIPKGVFPTYANMLSQLTDPKDGWLGIVEQDENNGNQKTEYFYYDGEWICLGGISNVNDATDTIKGILRLTNDLSGNAMYPELANVGMIAGSYNIGNGVIATFDSKGRCISINVTSTTEWEYESLTNTRNTDITSITVPNYDISLSEILVFWNGNLLHKGRDYELTNSTTITFKFTIKKEDDLLVKNIRYTGSLDKSVIINDSVASTDTCFSSDKSNKTYFRNNNNIVPNTDNVYDIGSASFRYNDIYATNGTIQTSDARQKVDIKDSDLGLNFINSINPSMYKRIGGERYHYGLISQNIENVLNGKDFAGLIYDEKNDIYGLRYEEFISPIIKAIQEQQEQINYLKLPIYKKLWIWIKNKIIKGKG